MHAIRHSGDALFVAALFADDPAAVARGDEYLWGRDILVAPVVEKGATERTLYLPKGAWYDFWTNQRHEGGAEITRKVDLETIPLYVRAGAIVPMGPVKQYTAEKVDAPLDISVYPGADGAFLLYEDDGSSFEYRKGAWMGIQMAWNDARRALTLRLAPGSRMLPPLEARHSSEGGGRDEIGSLRRPQSGGAILMDNRREFFQRMALAAAAAQSLPAVAQVAPDTTGHTLQCTFAHNNTTWKVYEDLSRRDGPITFVPARGEARVLTKRLEACFSQAAEPFLGLSREQIAASLPDLLADKLLAVGGDPDETQVRDAAPLIGSPAAAQPECRSGRRLCGGRRRYEFVEYFRRHEENASTRRRSMPAATHAPITPISIFPSCRAAPPNAPAPAGDRANTRERWEGLLGGWMPAVHKIFPDP